MTLSACELKDYESILNLETIDIFNVISGQVSVPSEWQTPIMAQLQTYCQSAPLGHASPAGFSANKKYMSNWINSKIFFFLSFPFWNFWKFFEMLRAAILPELLDQVTTDGIESAM